MHYEAESNYFEKALNCEDDDKNILNFFLFKQNKILFVIFY